MLCFQTWLGTRARYSSHASTTEQACRVCVFSELGGKYLTTISLGSGQVLEARQHVETLVAKQAKGCMEHTFGLSFQCMTVTLVDAEKVESPKPGTPDMVRLVGTSKALVSWDVKKAKSLLKHIHQATYAHDALRLHVAKAKPILPDIAVYESCIMCHITGKLASYKQAKKNKIVHTDLDVLCKLPKLETLEVMCADVCFTVLPSTLITLCLRDARLDALNALPDGLTALDLRNVKLERQSSLASLVGAIKGPCLVHLAAKHVGLEGTIPCELEAFKDLVHLNLCDNNLSGRIPCFFGNFVGLLQLFLSTNCLTGRIPTELGHASKLTRLALQDNQLTGTLPTELGLLSNLYHANFSRNQLSGGLPTFSNNLEMLDVSCNQLSQFEPTCFDNLTNLKVLDLGFNRLEGSIPASIGRLVSAIKVNLSHNLLTSIPLEFKFVGARGPVSDEFVSIMLSHNRFCGNIPRQVFQRHFVDLDLSYNRFTGRLPIEVGAMRETHTLNLSNNRFSGQVPHELGLLRHARRVDISGNRFRGKLPQGLSTLGKNYKGFNDQHTTLVYDKVLQAQQWPYLVLVPIDDKHSTPGRWHATASAVPTLP
jgi:Leucine-rich repeat (LRR) protein